MARIARAVVPAIPYHVTHFGNHTANIFYSDEDRLHYRRQLQAACMRFGLELWAYCWLSNHVHMIVVPQTRESLGRAIGLAHRRQSMWINRQMGWRGHLWANRFHSCPLDGPHLWRAVKYVETNPVRSGLVARAEDWPWSSARAHILGEADALLSPSRPFPGEVKDWRAWLSEALSEAEIAALRSHTRTGRPLGSPAFVERLEGLLGRVLRPQKAGRKRKVLNPEDKSA